MALSVSYCMGAKVSVSNPNRSGKAGCGEWDSCDLRVCGMRGDRVECAAGSRASCCDDSAEDSGVSFDGKIKRSMFDEAVSPVSVFEEETVLGQSFLEQRLLRGYGGVRCGHDTQVCPLPRAKGKAARATATLRLMNITAAQLIWPAPSGGRALSPLWGDSSMPHP